MMIYKTATRCGYKELGTNGTYRAGCRYCIGVCNRANEVATQQIY